MAAAPREKERESERERVLQGRPLAGAGASGAVKPAHQTLQREGCGGDITKGSSHLLSSGQTQPDTKRQGTQPLISGRGRQSGEEQGARGLADARSGAGCGDATLPSGEGVTQKEGQWRRGHGSEGRSMEAANPALLLPEAGDLFLLLDSRFLHFLPC